ncbi:MAG: hypothetical protein ACTHU0_19170 [Kofleriaceae bacterium]
MSSDAFEDHNPASAPAPRSSGGLRRAALVAQESFEEGGGARPDDGSGGDEEISEGGGGGGGRRLPESTKALIARMIAERTGDDGHANETVTEEPPAEQPAERTVDTDDPDAVAELKAKQATQPAEKPAETKPADQPDPSSEWKATAERYEAANRKLISDLEAERKRVKEVPAKRKGPDYMEDSLGSIRSYIAESLGLDDANHEDVSRELAWLQLDLTSKDLGVAVDSSASAAREAARARQLWAREKRERQSEGEKSVDGSADAEAQKAAAATQFIGTRLGKQTDYPHLHALAEHVDGMKPEAIVWQIVQREIQTGRWTQAQIADDEFLVREAAKIAETHYQALADLVGKARSVSQPSTATPEKPADASTSASTDPSQSHGARTLTTAAASVAPATPPAKKPAPTQEKPKFRTDRERREWALRHLPK